MGEEGFNLDWVALLRTRLFRVCSAASATLDFPELQDRQKATTILNRANWQKISRSLVDRFGRQLDLIEYDSVHRRDQIGRLNI